MLAPTPLAPAEFSGPRAEGKPTDSKPIEGKPTDKAGADRISKPDRQQGRTMTVFQAGCPLQGSPKTFSLWAGPAAPTGVSPRRGRGGGRARCVPLFFYEQARDQLTELVKRLEAGGLTLEQSLELWERGERLATICEEWLEGARARLAAAIAQRSDNEPAPGTPF